MSEQNTRTALVTGASRGIGRAVARRLAAGGATVAVHYGHDRAAADETVALITKDGGSAFAVGADLATGAGLDALFDGLATGLAGRPLDILVNNAGGGGMGGSVEQLMPDGFDRLFAVNVKAPLFIVQRALPLMADGGRIISISSCATRIAVAGQIAYAMSKSAVDTMTRTLANSLGGRRITVNAVAPGAVDTDSTAFLTANPAMLAGLLATTALGALAEPVDIADVVAFLASDGARWITGNVVDASGGSWLGPIG
jgi:NAD(P)-dependent dehydrogenase (short-subunit alcohol dehydrogenase family)